MNPRVRRKAPTALAAKTPREAQTRVDRLLAFQEELRDLEARKILVLNPPQKRRLSLHIHATLDELTAGFDVDANGQARSLSWGMRIATFLGGLAFCAGIYFLFLRVWGYLDIPVQLGSLAGLAMALMAAVHVAAAREKSLYFASLLGLAAFSAFVMNIAVTGSIFNIRPSPNAFLVWAAFALILAYAYRLRLLLLAGLLCLLGFLTMKVGTWWGCYWLDFGEKPENFMVSGLLITAVPVLFRHRMRDDFPPFYRLVGLLSFFTPILVLANWGASSYLGLEPDRIENIYQILGFVASAAAITAGIRLGFSGVVNIGAAYFTIFLYTKFFDWWWDWMPKYQFFLLVGAISVAVLYFLRRFRSLSQARAS